MTILIWIIWNRYCYYFKSCIIFIGMERDEQTGFRNTIAIFGKRFVQWCMEQGKVNPRFSLLYQEIRYLVSIRKYKFIFYY